MQFKKYEFLQCELLIARSGYTGEDGFELFIPLECIFEITSKLDDYCTSEKLLGSVLQHVIHYDLRRVLPTWSRDYRGNFSA